MSAVAGKAAQWPSEKLGKTGRLLIAIIAAYA